MLFSPEIGFNRLHRQQQYEQIERQEPQRCIADCVDYPFHPILSAFDALAQRPDLIKFARRQFGIVPDPPVLQSDRFNISNGSGQIDLIDSVVEIQQKAAHEFVGVHLAGIDVLEPGDIANPGAMIAAGRVRLVNGCPWSNPVRMIRMGFYVEIAAVQ